MYGALSGLLDRLIRAGMQLKINSLGELDFQTLAGDSRLFIDAYGGMRHATRSLLVTFGTGAGTGPVLVSSIGSAHAGVVSLTTGTAPVAGGIVANVAFSPFLPFAPRAVLIRGANSLTAPVMAYTEGYTITGFSIRMPAGVALAASSTYSWHYLLSM